METNEFKILFLEYTMFICTYYICIVEGIIRWVRIMPFLYTNVCLGLLNLYLRKNVAVHGSK